MKLLCDLWKMMQAKCISKKDDLHYITKTPSTYFITTISVLCETQQHQ